MWRTVWSSLTCFNEHLGLSKGLSISYVIFRVSCCFTFAAVQWQVWWVLKVFQSTVLNAETLMIQQNIDQKAKMRFVDCRIWIMSGHSGKEARVLQADHSSEDAAFESAYASRYNIEPIPKKTYIFSSFYFLDRAWLLFQQLYHRKGLNLSLFNKNAWQTMQYTNSNRFKLLVSYFQSIGRLFLAHKSDLSKIC